MAVRKLNNNLNVIGENLRNYRKEKEKENYENKKISFN